MISFWFYATLFFVCMLIMACITVSKMAEEISKLKAKSIELQQIVDDANRKKVTAQDFLSSMAEIASKLDGL